MQAMVTASSQAQWHMYMARMLAAESAASKLRAKSTETVTAPAAKRHKAMHGQQGG